MRVRPSLAAALLAGASLLALAGQDAQAQSRTQPSLQRQLEEMRRLIEQQQRTIGELQDQVRELQAGQTRTQETLQATEQKVDEARKAVSERPLITSTNPKVKLALSGQVNRLLNFADDGKSTKAYFVDNNNSVSRVRATATAELTDDLSAGADLELAISPNNSVDVSQVNEDGSQRDEFRKVEALFKSKTWGNLSFGRGDPATKDIARLDLSQTDVLAFASTGDPAGGLLFRTEDGDDLTTTNVTSVFTDFDSGRTNRVRYDTPKFQGLFGSASYGADQKWGVAARWAGGFGGFQATAGAGVQDPSSNTADLVYAGSASVLHEATGLNLTYGTAYRDQDDGTGRLQYVKLGWLHDFFAFGTSAFSIDFGLDKDAPGDGDEGKTIGLVALQHIRGYGTELFAGFRGYDLDEGDGPNVSTIYVGTVGTRVRF
jgi:predicted porin